MAVIRKLPIITERKIQLTVKGNLLACVARVPKPAKSFCLLVAPKWGENTKSTESGVGGGAISDSDFFLLFCTISYNQSINKYYII